MKHYDVLFWKALSKLSREAGSISCHPLQKYLDFRLLQYKKRNSEIPTAHVFTFLPRKKFPREKERGFKFLQASKLLSD